MHILTLDVESYYATDYTLSSSTTEAYIRDPRFETIGVGIRNADNSARVWLEHEQFKAWAAAQDWSEIALIAHHAHFDGLILWHHYGVRPGMWFDTLSMANACRPQYKRKSLAALSEAEGIGRKGDEVIAAKGKRRRDFTQPEWDQYGVYCLNDCDLEYRLFEIYSPEFSLDELRVIDTTIRMFTEPVLDMDVDVLTKHHEGEIARKQALLEKCAVDKADLMSNDKFAQLLLELGVDPPRKISEAKTKAAEERGEPGPIWSYAFAKTDPGMKSLLEHENDEVRWLTEARVGVKSTIEETRAKRFIGMISRGPAPVYLNYGKAHTGRWTGGDKANFQNLKRNGILRDAILAPPGHQLVVADSAQIEARTLAYVACQTWLVQAFREGRDIYSEVASEFYNRPVDRKRKEVGADGKEFQPDFIPGFVGKTVTLGLGFQMWWPKFAGTLLQGAMGGPPVQFGREMLEQMQIDYGKFINNPKKVNQALSIPTRLSQEAMLIHCIVCEHLVLQYRAKNKAIEGFWAMCQTAIEFMSRGIETVFGFNGLYRTEKERVVLPSGRVLHYPDLQCEVKNAGKKNERLDWSYWDGKERTKIYGGLFCENLIQATARDIVAGQMLRYVDTGRRVATTTHDEIVGVTPDADAPIALNTLLQLMHVAPSWAEGLPLAAEGGFARRYGDAK